MAGRPRNTFAAVKRSHALLKRMRRGESICIQEVSEEYGIQYQQARADLKFLENIYNLATHREGKTKFWSLPDAVEATPMNAHLNFSEEEIIQIRNWVAGGRTATSVAQELKTSITSITNIARGLSYRHVGGPTADYLSNTGRRALSVAEVRRILMDYHYRGVSGRELSKEYGVSKSAMQRIVNRCTYTEVDFPVLFRSDREQIRDLHQQGMSVGRIARMYNIDLDIVSAVIQPQKQREDHVP
jgi:Mor family transcriptional regulator